MQTEVQAQAAQAPGSPGAGRLLRLLRSLGLFARSIEVLLWAAFFALAVFFLAVRFWLLPNVERYREDIVAALSRSIGLPVSIGAIGADWRGLRPQLEIADLRVYDKNGREALVLPSVVNVVSWRSFLFRDLRLHSFAIDRPKLSIRRDAQGSITIGGIKLSADPGDARLTDWILGQNEIVISNAEIEWIDEKRRAPPLTLSALNFRLRNDGDEHEIGLSAQPPQRLGSGLELRAQLIGRTLTQPSAWNGRVYAELGYTDLAGWRAWVDYPIDVRQGQGALRLWATLIDGNLKRATADVALSKAVARLGKDLPLLELASVRGRVLGREISRGYEFGARELALETGRGPAMQSTSFRASIEGDQTRNAAGDLAEGWKPRRGSVSANLIELAPLAHLADFMPFPADLRKLLAELAPHGNLLDLRFDWSGELPDAAQFTAKARFAGLAMHAWRSIPGFAGLSGSVEANESKGTLYLASQATELDLPKVFPDPRMRLDGLSGQVDWERAGDGAVTFKLANLSFANADLAGSASGSYRFGGEGPGEIDLSAQLARADGRSTARYLPLSSIMGAATRAWLETAILGGQASDVRLRLKGDLRDFPFVDPAKGQFQLTARVSDAVLDYANGWPRIEDIDGELLFERDRMEIAARNGEILGAKLSNVRAGIAALSGGENTVLAVSGTAEGPTGEFLRFIAQSPVRRMVDGYTDPMSASGSGRLRLKLDLPLRNLAASKVAGEYQFSGNTLTVAPRLPPIERASGKLSFTETSLGVSDVRGQLFGGPVAISGGTQPEGGVAIVASGDAAVADMGALLDHPWRRFLNGVAPYKATVAVRAQRTQITFESPLRGVSSELPWPLSKSAADTLPLKVEVLPGESGTRERISVSLGRLLAAEFLRSKVAGAPGDGMVAQRSGVALNPAPGEQVRVPERAGMLVYGTLPALDLDRWLPLLAGGGAAAGTTSFDLELGALDIFGRRITKVALRAGAETGGWAASVKSSELVGELAYRSEGNGMLQARLSHFSIPDDAPGARRGSPGQEPARTAGQEPAPASPAARDFPSVDLVAESFVYRGKKIGRVEILAQHEGPDWRIERIAMLNPDSSLSGKGMWRTAAGSQTALDFQLAASDVGKLLERLGYPEHVKGGSAQLSGVLAWDGDPLAIDYQSLSGNLALQAEDGRFLEIEPGIGKLVSLMSLQMLPRRIALDFRDVFSKGFQWDRISSALLVKRGVMTTDDFRMRGSAAEVAMTGEIDLARETQKLRVKVIPSLGDTASTVLGFLNPIAGVATMIAQRVLKNPLGQIFAYEYAITGNWGDPKVEKLSTTASESTGNTAPGAEVPAGRTAPPALKN